MVGDQGEELAVMVPVKRRKRLLWVLAMDRKYMFKYIHKNLRVNIITTEVGFLTYESDQFSKNRKEN